MAWGLLHCVFGAYHPAYHVENINAVKAKTPQPGQNMTRHKLFPPLPSIRVKNSNSIFFLSRLPCGPSHSAHVACLETRMEWCASPEAKIDTRRRRDSMTLLRSRRQWPVRRRADIGAASPRDSRRVAVAGCLVWAAMMAPVAAGRGSGIFVAPTPDGAVILSD